MRIEYGMKKIEIMRLEELRSICYMVSLLVLMHLLLKQQSLVFINRWLQEPDISEIPIKN